MKRHILSILLLCLCAAVKAQYSVSSPDRSVWVHLKVDWKRNIDEKKRRPNGLKMTVSAYGKNVIRNKEVELEVLTEGHRRSFGKSAITLSNSSTTPMLLADTDDDSLKSLGTEYNRLMLQTATGIVLEVLAFNRGVAYRFALTGFPADYKVLNVSDVFPLDRPNAIVGTFTGRTVLPWRTMRCDEEADPTDATEKADLQGPTDEWENTYPSNKVVSWRDALSSVSIGTTFHWFSGSRWGKVSESMATYADFTYKYLYGGVSFTPCHGLLVIYTGHDFAPFTHVIGSVHTWDVTARLGFSLPVQNGYDVWHFTPYVAATYMALLQHGETHPGYSDLPNRHHHLLGLGLKVHYMMRGRVSLGLGYEYQFFTGSQEPVGRHGLLLTLGFGL